MYAGGTAWNAPVVAASSRLVTWYVELLAMSSTTSTVSLASCVVVGSVPVIRCTCCQTAGSSVVMTACVALRRAPSSTRKLTVWWLFVRYLCPKNVGVLILHYEVVRDSTGGVEWTYFLYTYSVYICLITCAKKSCNYLLSFYRYSGKCRVWVLFLAHSV